jgi:hypothetical protein
MSALSRIAMLPDPPEDPQLAHLKGLAMLLKRHGLHLFQRCRQLLRRLDQDLTREELGALANELDLYEDSTLLVLPDAWDEDDDYL